jgi:hypothetical protein
MGDSSHRRAERKRKAQLHTEAELRAKIGNQGKESRYCSGCGQPTCNANGVCGKCLKKQGQVD